ncbi:uncharacterized protein APUU_50313S [Aspergillus puulaauensis]|uniref:DUF1763-domain-containing protein n=1 Tax=Aspergillus puulaauensis TaxID=1220207 RepID=A0A7R8AP55_9EURO|nr:uncharacterized protein APUU_50313S [Aspergillus puulaauensis]BCS25602.1 hypothetical protein APUU_50313S [Aspergillus puulaauensis]
MNAIAADQQSIIHAYRQLYRQGLKAVNYSTPSRHVFLATLRSSFRSLPAQDFDSRRIINTLNFLHKAANIAGIEHKIVRNLLMIKFWGQPNVRSNMRNLGGIGINQSDPTTQRDACEQWNQTLMLLNESLGTCLR